MTITGAGGALVEGTLADGFEFKGQLYPQGFLSGVWGADSFRIIVGDGSQIFVWMEVTNEDGTLERKWVPQQNDVDEFPEYPDLVPTTVHLRAVWAFSPTDVWAAGLGGKILHWDGVAWEQQVSFTDQPIEAIYGSSPDNIYASGAGGTILHYNGSVWAVVSSQTDQNLRDIFSFEGGDIWAVGAGGTIMRRGELDWGQIMVTPQVTPPAEEGGDPEVTLFESDLYGVWGATPDDVWAVGANGKVIRWNGTEWLEFQEAAFGITLRSIWGRSADDIWAVGLQGHVIHWDGTAWNEWATGSVATLYAIDGDHGSSSVRIAGDIGTVLYLYEGEDPPE